MKSVFFVLAGLFLLWIGVSSIIFAFRHPWATETELFLHIPDAILLRKVPYSEMRPRE